MGTSKKQTELSTTTSQASTELAQGTPLAQGADLDPASFERAYLAVRADLEALPAESLVPVNLDIFAAVTTACGVISELKPLRGEIARRLPDFDLAKFDKLHDYAMACGYAHSTHQNATQPSDNLRVLQEEAVILRDSLLNDASALAHRGILELASLRDLRGPVGYKNVASDLQRLVSLLKANWDKIVGKTPTTLDELERGAALVTRMVHAIGTREQGSTSIAATADLRTRAFTLFTSTYDEARSAVIFLRWKQRDADDIIPSLYAGRGGRRKELTPSTDTEETNTVESVPLTANQPSPTVPSAATVSGSSAPPPLAIAPSAGGPFMT